MKRLIFLILFFSGSSQGGVLPDDWNQHIYGMLVTEAELGIYKETSKIEGADFFFFEKEYQEDGKKYKCEYPVLASRPFYIADIVSCNIVK